MEKKKWYKSKAIIASMAYALCLTYADIDVNLFADALPNVPQFVYGFLALLGGVGLRTAKTEIA